MNALPNMDPFEGADSNQTPRQPVAALTNSNPNLKYEESTLTENSCFYQVSELISLGKEDYFGDSLQSEFADGMIKFQISFLMALLLQLQLLERSFNRMTIPDDLARFFALMTLPPSPSTRILPQKNKVSETSTSSTSVGSFDLIDSSALRSTEISCSVVSSEKNVVDTVDFSSKFPLSGSFLLEGSSENSPARDLIIAVLIWTVLSLTLFFHLPCQVQLYLGRRHRRLDCFPVSCRQN
ncbi:hypothetical protein SLEP1_g4964 [Rubroshorea leprosula]|uniref:Uncharacterized protein n=1 Tax=Rubroshorea leprosula TaxID=152421 RepID=A0AAV5HY95_9ROSI|nr:hypothetical protein SLEP1_g4964 [Rubroshorea leprosula]